VKLYHQLLQEAVKIPAWSIAIGIIALLGGSILTGWGIKYGSDKAMKKVKEELEPKPKPIDKPEPEPDPKKIINWEMIRIDLERLLPYLVLSVGIIVSCIIIYMVWKYMRVE